MITINVNNSQGEPVKHTFSREQLASFGQLFITRITGRSELAVNNPQCHPGLVGELDKAMERTLGVRLASFAWPAFIPDGLDATGDAIGDWLELANCYPYGGRHAGRVGSVAWRYRCHIGAPGAGALLGEPCEG